MQLLKKQFLMVLLVGMGQYEILTWGKNIAVSQLQL